MYTCFYHQKVASSENNENVVHIIFTVVIIKACLMNPGMDE